jgi:hypothetical protein
MKKFDEAHDRLVEAEYIVNLIEITADSIIEGDKISMAPKAGSISGAARIVVKKLVEAVQFLKEAQAEAGKRLLA